MLHCFAYSGVSLSITFGMMSSNVDKVHRHEEMVRYSVSASSHNGVIDVKCRDDFTTEWVENDLSLKGVMIR